MRALIRSIQGELATAGYQTYFVDVPSAPVYPYVLLWTGAGAPSREVLADDVWLRDRLGVTGVALTPFAAVAVMEKTRTVLEKFIPTSDKWNVDPLRLYDSQDVQKDDSVKLPDTNRAVYFGVDLYRLTGSPKPTPPAPVPVP